MLACARIVTPSDRRLDNPAPGMAGPDTGEMPWPATRATLQVRLGPPETASSFPPPSAVEEKLPALQHLYCTLRYLGQKRQGGLWRRYQAPCSGQMGPRRPRWKVPHGQKTDGRDCSEKGCFRHWTVSGFARAAGVNMALEPPAARSLPARDTYQNDAVQMARRLRSALLTAVATIPAMQNVSAVLIRSAV